MLNTKTELDKQPARFVKTCALILAEINCQAEEEVEKAKRGIPHVG
jgi:hypothetical protein